MPQSFEKGNSYFVMLLTAAINAFGLCLRVMIRINLSYSRTAAHSQDELLRHTAILFTGMAVVHACNLVYQMAVSRALPDGEYSLLMAFLGVLAILSYPLSTLTTGLSHYCSLLQQAGRTADVGRLLKKWLWITGVPAVFLGIVVILFAERVAEFMHLDRVAPVVIAGAVLPALFWLPVFGGVGRGLQLFGWSSFSGIAGAMIRLFFGAGFVWFLYPACGWAMLGHSAGVYSSVAVLSLGLFLVLHGGKKNAEPLPSLRIYLLRSFFVLTAFAVLMNADVVLVKHYLPSNIEFAKAATLGRIVAFLPAAVAMAMFPKVASSSGTTFEHRRIFIRSFGYTAFCVAVAATGCFVLPRLLLQILFGIQTVPESMVSLTRLMALAMSASALLNVVTQFLLAQRRFKETIPTGVACFLYLCFVHFFHHNAGQVAWGALLFNTVALLAGVFGIFCRRADRIPPDPYGTDV
jgi:O-antigen/teichoic acid export membrane protein